MKKLLFTITVLSVAFGVQAQTARVGLAAGLNYSSIIAEGDDADRSFKPGLSAGMITEIEFGKLCVAPAIYYSQKGVSVKMGDNGSIIKGNINLNYIEVPVNFLYKASEGMNSWFIGAGPYIAAGINSKVRAKADDETYSEPIKFGKKEDDDVREFDAGVNILAGYRWNNGLFVSVNYTRGLYNIHPLRGEDYQKVHNHLFGLKLGYFFKGLKD